MGDGLIGGLAQADRPGRPPRGAQGGLGSQILPLWKSTSSKQQGTSLTAPATSEDGFVDQAHRTLTCLNAPPCAGGWPFCAVQSSFSLATYLLLTYLFCFAFALAFAFAFAFVFAMGNEETLPYSKAKV